ncbi:MAG TPA: S49 family peptidase [Anaerolineae bacterium]|nr:S49 family peptidase [Anaerolineae bacterium]
MQLYDLMINSAWAITPDKLEEILQVVEAKQLGELKDIEAKLSLADAGQAENRYKVENGIAFIKIYGTLAKRMNIIAAASGGTSYEIAGRDFQKALADPAVETILLDVDSPGGNVSGLMVFTNLIYESRLKKRIIAFCNGLAASAAYFIASAAHEVIISDKSAQAGSIGIIGLHMDRSAAYEQKGLKPTVLKAGKFKAVGNEYNPLSKDDEKNIQGKLDFLYGLMIQDIARNRGVTADVADKQMGQGRLFIGEQAIDVGLADRIESWDSLLTRLKGKYSGTIKTERNITAMNSLKAVAEDIQRAKDLPELKALEDACLLHFSEEAKTASNWLQEEKAKGISRKVTELADIRRRQILTMPKMQESKADYEIGQMIGQGK